MVHNRLRQALAGVSVTTTTPFSSDLSRVDVGSIPKNMEFLLNEGVEMIVPCGNTGEFYSLSEAEWLQVTEATANSIGERSAIAAGVGHSLTTALKMMDSAKDLGLDGVMIMYPQHVFSSEEGLLNYYRRLLDASRDIGVILYKKGPLLTDDMLVKLLEYENLVGVKYAFGRIADFAQSVQRVGNSIIWSCGTAERFAPFFHLAGSRGFTSGLCNFAPHLSLEMQSSLVSGDYARAMEIQAMITPLEFLREGRGKANNVPVIKAVMDHIGLNGGLCRPPIHPLNGEEQEALVEAISTWDLKSM